MLNLPPQTTAVYEQQSFVEQNNHCTEQTLSKNAGCSKFSAVSPASRFGSGDTDAAPLSRTFASVDRYVAF